MVFDQSDQRVWLVDDDDHVERTYLVSGSLYDNLFPGTYAVYSKSEQAWGVDDSGTMKYFVRFTQGTNGAAIGFHDIPIDDGQLVQTAAELGHAPVARLHPPAAVGRHRALGLRPGGDRGRRHGLTPRDENVASSDARASTDRSASERWQASARAR